MTTHLLTAELWLPQDHDVVFSFFADARNLEAVTPPWLRFAVLTPEPIVMRAGARIDYRLRVHGLPFRWQSEITVWKPPFRFVDEQRRGPYRRWSHMHTFEEQDGGTLCRDVVEYAVPGGRFIHWLIVRRDVERIFAYRQEFLRNLFRAGFAARPLDSTRAGMIAATNFSP
jgi:ligand-binding SRPBCC domain-containing protein